MTTRALFQFNTKVVTCWNKELVTVKFSAIYDSRIPEHERFMQATPSGSFEMTVDAKVAENFELGKYYYFDVSLAPDFK
jgi:hypothetical protein